MHSYYSDGVLSPGQLVKKFKEEGYDVIALTDHDGIEGVKEFLAACEAAGVQGVSGIEFSTSHILDGVNHEIHLLGYHFDPDNEEFKEVCADLKRRRHERNVKLIAKLNEKGYELDIDDLESQSKGKYVGKPNIARVLVSRGYFSYPREVFDKLLETPEIKAIRKETTKSPADKTAFSTDFYPCGINSVNPLSLTNLKDCCLVMFLHQTDFASSQRWRRAHPQRISSTI